jgi:hypothetical protein
MTDPMEAIHRELVVQQVARIALLITLNPLLEKRWRAEGATLHHPDGHRIDCTLHRGRLRCTTWVDPTTRARTERIDTTLKDPRAAATAIRERLLPDYAVQWAAMTTELAARAPRIARTQQTRAALMRTGLSGLRTQRESEHAMVFLNVGGALNAYQSPIQFTVDADRVNVALNQLSHADAVAVAEFIMQRRARA